MTREAKCKFCGYLLQLEIDDECPKADGDFWLNFAACNRCADYREGITGITDSLVAVCRAIIRAREDNPNNRDVIETKCRELLVAKTKQYTRLVCTYFRKMTVWEPDFAQMVFDNPDKLGVVLGTYRRGIPRA